MIDQRREHAVELFESEISELPKQILGGGQKVCHIFNFKKVQHNVNRLLRSEGSRLEVIGSRRIFFIAKVPWQRPSHKEELKKVLALYTGINSIKIVKKNFFFDHLLLDFSSILLEFIWIIWITYVCLFYVPHFDDNLNQCVNLDKS